MEPGNLVCSYWRSFYLDRADRLLEQTQRRVYGGAARAPRRCGSGGGIVKNFHWEGEPQRELDTATATTTTSLRILQLIIRGTASTTSGAPPSSRTAYSYSIRHLYSTAIERTVYAPGAL